MKVSVKWLRQLVNLDGITPDEIAHKLTFAGVDVDDVIHLASATGLVIGEILDCVEHPSSDHLHVLQVNLGEKYGVKQIVCGAPNVATGDIVPCALVGATLPNGINIKAGG